MGFGPRRRGPASWGAGRIVAKRGGAGSATATPAILTDIGWSVYVDAIMEKTPPTALLAQAQNVGIVDGAVMATMTDWTPNAGHLAVDAAKPFTFKQDTGRGNSALRAPAATGGKGCALPSPISMLENGITTFVVAVQDFEVSSSGGTIFSLYRGNFYNSMPVVRSAIDQWAMRDDAGAGTGSVPDRWFFDLAERRARLHVYEIDRTGASIVIRRWDNGVPQPDVSVSKAVGVLSLTRLFALSTFSGNGGIFNCDIVFAGVSPGPLTQGQRDVISNYFYAKTGEPAWTNSWSYLQVQPWLRTLVNAAWEADPTLAPSAWRARAQNTGVLDLTTIDGVTDWGTGNHMFSDLGPQRVVYLAAGLNGQPTLNFDGVDDGVVSTYDIELPPDHGIVLIGAPDPSIRVILEHGPNATSGPDGTAVLAIPSGAEYIGQFRRAGAVYRNRGPYADGNPHSIVWECNANASGMSFRVDRLSVTTSVANNGSPTGNYSGKLNLGCRSGGSFAVAGEFSLLACLAGNKAAIRVVEYAAKTQYGV